jgi:protein-disulfide isomerase
MPAKSLASLPATPASRKGVALLAPAILLLGATLAVGQSTPPPAQLAQAAAPAAPAPTPAAAPAPTASAPAAETAPSGPFTPAQRKEIEAIIKDILVNNPEVLLEAQNALEAKMDKIQADRMAVAIKEHAGELFRPAASPVVGNVKGDVPVIEFFDYNCGYCKKAFSDLAKLIDKDKKVRVILKELPILAKGSEEASRVALAAKMQGKYWEFHRAMLESQGQANEASALRVAEKLGLDMPRLKKDMASAEVKKEIDETRQLATKMGIQGTPHFIVGDRIIPGAPENLAELLGKHVDDVRKDGCKVC